MQKTKFADVAHPMSKRLWHSAIIVIKDRTKAALYGDTEANEVKPKAKCILQSKDRQLILSNCFLACRN